MNRLAVALSLPLGAALLLQANPSQALTTVDVGGNYYDIDIFTGSLADFQASGLNLPWFNSLVDATAFADAFTAVDNSQYNSVSGDYGDAYLGPLFYTLSSSATFVAWNTGANAPFGDNNPFTGSYVCGPDVLAPAEFQNYDCTTSTLKWAYGNPTPPSPSVPAPLPLLGATAAFSFSRKLRRRVNAQKFTF
jgi:hypothetical protein